MKIAVDFYEERKPPNPWWFVLAVIIATLFAALLYSSVFAEPDYLTASYYSYASLKSESTWKNGEQPMANGKKFDENAMTCAARKYPLGTTLKVTNLKTGKSVVVVVTDRIGKRFAETRVDLTKAAFSRIADLREGIVKVKVEIIRGGRNEI